jgi:pimeloyl-ACP methyl ester carboxylesterase
MTQHEGHETPHYSRWHYLGMRVMTALVILLFVLLIGLGVTLLAWSPGRPAPLQYANGEIIPGSLSERVFVDINGVRQGMIIQSVAPSNPVLLFLHGGPGMPTFFLNTTHPTGLESEFTVVWWEQRGAGLSFSPDLAPETMTVDQLVADTIGVTDYLRKRFGQDKIYLLGHSWGSFLGIQVAATAPDRFHAYIGMGQLSHQLRSEIAAHDYLLSAYRARDDKAMVAKLQAAPVSLKDGTSDAWMAVRDDAMHGVGVGTTRDMGSVITGIFVPVWQCHAYTLTEKVAIWRGKAWSRSLLWNMVIRTDLRQKVRKLGLPVYFLMGRYDYTSSYNLAYEFFQTIDAPVKGFYTFLDAAHSLDLP